MHDFISLRFMHQSMVVLSFKHFIPGKCSFSDCDRWWKNSSYTLWLECDMDNFEAKCKVCLKAFDVSNMRDSALKSHKKGKKHIYLMETQHLL